MRPLTIEELDAVAGGGAGQDSADYNGYSGDDMNVDHGWLAQANAILMSGYNPATNSYTITAAFISAYQSAYPDTYRYESSRSDFLTYDQVQQFATNNGYGEIIYQ